MIIQTGPWILLKVLSSPGGEPGLFLLTDAPLLFGHGETQIGERLSGPLDPTATMVHPGFPAPPASQITYENHRFQKRFEVFKKKDCRLDVHLICRQGFAGGERHVRHFPAIKAAEEER